MTILFVFESFKLAPHKKERRGAVTTTGLVSSSGKLPASRSLLLPSPRDDSSKLLQTRSSEIVDMRSASVSPHHSQASTTFSREFVLRHPTSVFGPRGVTGRIARSYSGNSSSIDTNHFWTSDASGFVLQPRSWSHENLFSLSGDTTEFISVPLSSRRQGESIPVPPVTTPPRRRGPTGRSFTRVFKTPDHAATVYVQAAAKPADDQTSPMSTYFAAATTAPDRAPRVVPLLPVTDGTTFGTPEVPVDSHRDTVTLSLPRSLSLRPRAKGWRDSSSLIRRVNRHHSEASFLIGSRNANTISSLNLPPLSRRREHSIEESQSGDNSGRGIDLSEEGSSSSMPPSFPRW